MARKKLKLPTDYGGAAQARDFRVETPRRPEKGMMPTAIAVACTKCKATGTIDMPLDADIEKLADKMMGGKIVKGFCMNCRRETEFRPFTPAELQRDGLQLIARYVDNYDELQVQGQIPAAVSEPGEAMKKALEASNEYMKGVREKADTAKKAAPRIIVP